MASHSLKKIFAVKYLYVYISILPMLICCETSPNGNEGKIQDMSFTLLPSDSSLKRSDLKRLILSSQHIKAIDSIKFRRLDTLFSNSNLVVQNSEFVSNVVFLNVDTMMIENTVFNDTAIFKGLAARGSKTLFNACQFDKVLNMSQMDYKNEVVIYRSVFKQALDLSVGYAGGGEFRNNISITGSAFFGGIKLSNTSFFSSFSLSSSSFECDSVELDKTYFENAPDFTFVQFPALLKIKDLKTSHWTKVLDLQTCLVDERRAKKCVIKIDYSKDFDPASLDPSKLIIPFDKFQIQFPNEFSPNRRLAFLKQLRDNSGSVGDEDSFRNWDIEYRKAYNEINYSTLGRIKNFSQEYWWNFGYSEYLVIFPWMLILFVLFWFVNFRYLEWIINSVYYDSDLSKNFSKKNGGDPNATVEFKLNSIREKFSYSFFLTTNLFFGLKVKHEALNYKNFPGMLYIYFMYLLGTFHVAYTLAIILK